MSKHAITLVEVADRAGVVPEEMHLIHGPFTRDGGYASAQALLSDGPRVTCLFAVNDVMAVGAMAALRNTAWRSPRRSSVAGFDDIAAHSTCPGTPSVPAPRSAASSGWPRSAACGGVGTRAAAPTSPDAAPRQAPGRTAPARDSSCASITSDLSLPDRHVGTRPCA